MAKFRLFQQNFTSTLIPTLVMLGLFTLLRNFTSETMAFFICFVGGIALAITTAKYLGTVVEFYDSSLKFKKNIFSKPIVLDYNQLQKVTYTHDRFKQFFVFTADSKIKLPPPASVEQVKGVFQWLQAKNQNLKTEIMDNQKLQNQ